ncbi:uncharacterized protein DS421_20g699830 [Arachis hypogaea]|nr:uncharacterized protein DS421_20g699830 [Arachis hypogaea]
MPPPLRLPLLLLSMFRVLFLSQPLDGAATLFAVAVASPPPPFFSSLLLFSLCFVFLI